MVLILASLLFFSAQITVNAVDMSDYVDYQTFELDGEIENMLWCGTNDETILIKTADGSIYRSRDRGSNWKRLKSLMNKQGSKVTDEGDVSLNLILFAFISILDWQSAQDDVKSVRR